MAAPRKTLAEYLQWAALKPRTSGWSALVAYDRNKCNQMLLQEYIEKHDQHSVMPPINETYGSSEFTWHWLLDYVTDAPRLSFENDPDGQKAEVNMRMAIVGGKNIVLNDAGGFAQVNRISSFDPLDHPTLEVERVQLKDIQGGITEDGEVLLDLGDPDYQGHHWQVSGDESEHECLAAGAFFKRKFREADRVRRTFTLGTLAQTSQAFMKPQSFRLRAIMEEGAASRGASNYGNGAIEMRIALDDDLRGGEPGEDWVYPLPSDRADLNAMMMFGSRFFMHGIIGKGTARAFNAPNAQFESRTDSRGFVEWLGVKYGTEGDLEIPPFEALIGTKKLTFHNYKLPIHLSADHRLTMTLFRDADGSLSLGVGMGSQDVRRLMVCTVNGVPFHCLMGLGLSATYRFSLDQASHRLKVKLGSFNSFVRYVPNLLLPLDVLSYMDTSAFRTGLGNLVALTAMQIFNGLEEIDVFTLNTLLFNAENAIQLKTADLTGEMLLFGSIGPGLDTFFIDPVEVLLTHGQAHRFKTEPVTQGVKWTAVDLEGSTVGAGQMIEDTGAYTAPSLADIQGTYKRIKIIATGPGTGSNRHISRALVTVVARAITLNPLIEICNSSKAGEAEQTRKFSAHSTSGALKWWVQGDGRINETADTNGENIYYAPPTRAPGIPTFTIDEVIVENTATRQRQSSLVVVNHHGQLLALSVDFNGVLPNQVRLIGKFNGEPPPAPLTWECIPAEVGSIDSVTGIFTVSESNNSQFVLIVALMDLGAIKVDGFIILPIPLAPFPPKPAPEILYANTYTDGLANSLIE